MNSSSLNDGINTHKKSLTVDYCYSYLDILAVYAVNNYMVDFSAAFRVYCMELSSDFFFSSFRTSSVSLVKRCLTVMDDTEEVAGIGTERRIPAFYKRDKYQWWEA